jgi:predicted dehydrogenase
MKFLICGLGSIGKRHLNNLERLGVPCKNIAIYRTRKGAVNFGDDALNNHGGHPLFNNLKEALSFGADVALVTNPTSLHIPVALECAKAGCHLFIEKPLSHNMDDLEELVRVVNHKKNLVFVAYNRRFHPLLKQARSWLDEKKIGKITSVTAEMAERVTDWHSWEDFRISYSSRQDLGGGAILTQCHELDYLYWLFGKPSWVFAAGGELGNYNIGVEDTCTSILSFPNQIIASLHIDYIKKPSKGSLEITGTDGRINWEYFNRKLSMIPIEGEATEIYDKPDNPQDNWITRTFLEEIEYFLDCIKSGTQPSPGLIEGIDTLKIMLATKRSLAEKRLVYI